MDMKQTILLTIALMLTFASHAQIIFENEDQRWQLTGVASNDDFTAIFCDITILNNKAGCFEVHEFDKNASIYISGSFGNAKLVESTFEGYYEPWHRYTNVTNWNYYNRGNQYKIAHATFYFPRIPAGITSFKLHFYGGIGHPEYKRKSYVCPAFTANISAPNNKNTTPQTHWTENELRDTWENKIGAPIEGIYNFIATSNTKYWGNVRHKLAIIKEGQSYKIIYLSGSNDNIWKEGELKGTFSATTTPGLYKVNTWYLENKTPSKADFYLEYDNRKITLYDAKNYVETIFMKLYPEYDIDETTVPVSNNTVEEDQPKGNGSGFFISTNVIATNNHVVENAKRIEVVIQTPQKVSHHDAKVLCVDKVNDLALITIEDSSFQNIETLPYNIQYRSSDVGSSVFTMGYPMAQAMGTEIKITDGIISSKTGYEGQIAMYQISAPIQPGNSGGPMFDKNGHLIGITSAGIPGANNVGYAIKSSYLHQLIDAAPIDIQDITQEPNKQEFVEMIKTFSPYVVMILIY